VTELRAVTASRLEVSAETDPGAIEEAAASLDRKTWFQFAQPLPATVLRALAAAAERHPLVAVRAWGSADPTLEWLSEFREVGSLQLNLYEAVDFSRIAGLGGLRDLSLGETASKAVSLAFLAEIQTLESLWIEGHGRGFEAVSELPSLRKLSLRVPRVKSLDALRGHPKLEVFVMDLGGIRDLTPLPGVSRLRALGLWGVRKLDTVDLAQIGGCTGLVALSLGALRNVGELRALEDGPRNTLRFLELDGMKGLATLREVGMCERLEQIQLVDSRPTDRRLDFVAAAPALDHLYVGDPYSEAEVKEALDAFKGTSFWYRGSFLVGEGTGREVSWRRPVDRYLAVP
jgi:hypothetical protein